MTNHELHFTYITLNKKFAAIRCQALKDNMDLDAITELIEEAKVMQAELKREGK